MKYVTGLLIIFGIVFFWSAINPKDYFTWFLEIVPAIIGLALLIITYKRFQFTNFVYSLILIHCCILFVGGHYTYAEVPLFNWIREVFHQSRNNYDKLGHFAQGFVPALIARELLIRKNVVANKAWRNVFIVALCMGISMTYEFFEWFVAIASGQSADAFLGTQGDVWDTQWDMFFATIGAISALTILSKYHDTQLQSMQG